MLKPWLLCMLLGLSIFKCDALTVDNIEFDVIKLNDQVYLFAQPFGDTFINFGVVVADEGAALITAMMLNNAPTIEKLIRQVTGANIKYLFNIDADTYQHHANQYFAAHGATIVAQQAIKDINPFVDLAFTEQVSLDLGSEVITAVHTSARAPGDSAIYLKNSNVVFLGDAFRNDWLMYSSQSGYQKHTAAPAAILARSDDQTQFVPGNRKTVAISTAQDVAQASARQRKFVMNVLV